MKKYIITLVTLLIISLTTFATAVTTIVNPGSDNGAYRAVLTMIGNEIDHDFIQANNPIMANTYFLSENVLTMWSTEWPGDDSLPSVVMDANTIIAVQAYETILCSRTYTSLEEMSGKTIKIATWGDAPAIEKFINTLGTSNIINFKIVPYGGSGDTVRGYLGWDTDTIFTIQTKQAKVEVDGTCFAFSANGDLDFAFIDVIVSVNANEAIVNKYRQVVSDLSQTEAWETAFEGTFTQVMNADNAEALVKKVNAAIELNTN
jgi:hypothetical protein